MTPNFIKALTEGAKLSKALVEWNRRDFPVCNTKVVESQKRFLWFFPRRLFFIHSTPDGGVTFHAFETKTGRVVRIIPEVFRSSRKNRAASKP